MTYDYFLQDDKTESLRRYPRGSQTGERWRVAVHDWTPECATRRACELTGDRRITEAEATRRTQR